jgi:formylglycine-generating enzyme required for sulfatase activity
MGMVQRLVRLGLLPTLPERRSPWFAWDYYQHSPKDDPPGPASGVLRVVRGADWRLTLMGCNYTRVHTEPWRANPYIGFRVVCDVKP